MKKYLFLLIPVLLGISAIAQNSATLKLNLEKNKVYRLKSTSEQNIAQTVNGSQQTTNVKSNQIVSIKMIDAKADFFVAEIRFDTLITNTNQMGKVIIINSANEGNIKSEEMGDVMSCIMHRLTKNAMYVKLDYTGKIIQIVNSKMLSDIITKDTASITGKTAQVAKMQIKNMLTDKALRSMIEMFTYNLPSKPIVTGEKWEIAVPMEAGGMSLEIITTYHLGAIQGNTANITAESNIKAAANADPIDAGQFKITYADLKGLGKSGMVLDTRNGLFISNTTKTRIAGNMSLSGPGVSMQIPLEIEGESKVVTLP